jgi:hypothetical protein
MSAPEWANKDLGGYIKMEALQRREVIKEMSQDGMTQRQIGEVLGISQPTVKRDLDFDSNVSKQETENLKAWNAKHQAELDEQATRECFGSPHPVARTPLSTSQAQSPTTPMLITPCLSERIFSGENAELVARRWGGLPATDFVRAPRERKAFFSKRPVSASELAPQESPRYNRERAGKGSDAQEPCY